MVIFSSKGRIFRNSGDEFSTGNVHYPDHIPETNRTEASVGMPGVIANTKKNDSFAREERKILIVEDEQMSALFLMEVIGERTDNDCRIDVVHVGYGEEAVKKCEQEDFNLVLMDIRLPAMNGLEATRAIKKVKPAQPVVMETAYAFPDDRERAFDAGCDDYLAKPISMEYLQKILKQYILP